MAEEGERWAIVRKRRPQRVEIDDLASLEDARERLQSYERYQIDSFFEGDVKWMQNSKGDPVPILRTTGQRVGSPEPMVIKKIISGGRVNSEGKWEDYKLSRRTYRRMVDDVSEEIPEFVYHATLGKNEDSIIEHGLEPRIGELSIHAFGKKRYEEKIGTPKVWGTSQNKANVYASMIAPMSYLEDNAIFRIKTDGLDFEPYGFGEFFTDNVVPPSHIKFMYHMDGDLSEEACENVAHPSWCRRERVLRKYRRERVLRKYQRNLNGSKFIGTKSTFTKDNARAIAGWARNNRNLNARVIPSSDGYRIYFGRPSSNMQ